MNRRLLFVLSLSLCLIGTLSACSAKKEGSVTTLPAGNARALAAPSRPADGATFNSADKAQTLSTRQLSDREAMALYQDTITLVSILNSEKAIAANRLDDRQQLADYQGTLPLYNVPVNGEVRTRPASFEQINDHQQLADYQATLPHFSVEPSSTQLAAK